MPTLRKSIVRFIPSSGGSIKIPYTFTQKNKFWESHDVSRMWISNTMSVKCTSNDSWGPFDMNWFRYRLILSIRGLVRILVRKFWVGEYILENIHLHLLRTIYIKVSANILWNTVLDKAPSPSPTWKKKPMVKRHRLSRSKINQTIITD